MKLGRAASVQEDQSLGQLGELSSPLLAKLQEALVFVAWANGSARALGSKNAVLQGIIGTKLYIGWFKEQRKLLIALKDIDCPQDHKHDLGCHIMPFAPLNTPSWLQSVAPDAEIHSIVLQVFDSFQNTGQTLAERMKSVTGGANPRRITCTGFCAGGSVATVAALYAAIHFPTADVRCITFGAQLTGNAAFSNAFRWLVGTSYRVVYRRDPVPALKSKRNKLLGGLVHVHGEIFINDSMLAPGKQPHDYRTHKDLADHDLLRYAEALHAICSASLQQDQAEGEFHSRIAACYLATDQEQQQQAHRLGHGMQREVKASMPAAVQAKTRPSWEQEISYAQQHLHCTDLHSQSLSGTASQSRPGSRQLSAIQQAPAFLDTAKSAAASEERGTHAGSLQESSTDTSQSAFLPDMTNTFTSPKTTTGTLLLDKQHASRFELSTKSAATVSISTTANHDRTQDTFNAQPQRIHQPKDGLRPDTGRSSHFSAGSACSVNPARPDVIASSHSLDSLLPDPCSPQQAGEKGHHCEVECRQETVHEQHSSAILQQAGDHEDPNSAELQASKLEKASSGAADSANVLLSPVGASEGLKETAIKPQRAFSMLAQDDISTDLQNPASLEKVLVTGKISSAVVVAAAAYRSQQDFQLRTGITQCQLIVDAQHTNTHVHVGWLEGGTAVLAFRGTSTAQDSLQDVKIMRHTINHLQDMFPGAQAHTGFLQQFAGVCSPDNPDKNMATVLQRLSGDQMPIRVVCCGHSLGGALATLGATWAALQYPQADVRCITFGSPRVGNMAFKKAFHALVGTSLRLVHGGDPVPLLPPAFVYHHVEGAIHIFRNKIKLRNRPWIFKLRPNVADHLVARYNAGIFMHMPGGLEDMPLPRPSNMKRLSSLQASDLVRSGTVGRSRYTVTALNLLPMSKHSTSPLDRLEEGRSDRDHNIHQIISCDDLVEVWQHDGYLRTSTEAAGMATSSAVRTLDAVAHQAVSLGSQAIQEAEDVVEVLGYMPEDESGSQRGFLKVFGKRSKVASPANVTEQKWWWHVFGCSISASTSRQQQQQQ